MANVQQNRAGAQFASAHRKKRKRHGKRVLHYILLLLFLGAAGAVLSLTVFFKIEGVEVVGTDKYTPDEIVEASGVLLEENLLRIDKAQIRNNLLERFPYIRSVEIRRVLPPAVEITVHQEEPSGAIRQGEEIVLINREGKVLERGIVMVPENIPIIKGIETEGAAPGQMLGEYIPEKSPAGGELSPEEQSKVDSAEAVHERLLMFQYLLEAMEASDFTHLTNVDLTDRLNMRIIYENRIALELGSESQLEYKLSLLKKVLEDNIGPNETGRLTPEVNRNRVVYDPTPLEDLSQDAVVSTPQPEEEDEPEEEPVEPEAAAEI